MEAVAASAQVKPWYLPPSQRGGVIVRTHLECVAFVELMMATI
jgi:hypothetical protein